MIEAIKQLLHHLISQVNTWKKLAITLILAFGLGVGTLAYQFTYMYMTGSREYYHSLSLRLRADDKITPLMETYRTKIGSDRLMVAELHDGKKNTTGVRFAYMSGTYEADDKGMTKILLDFQNIPTSLMAGMWTPLLDGECVLIKKDDNPATLVAQTQFADYGSHQTYMCPIMTPDGSTMVGVLFATWRSGIEKLDVPTIESEMKRASLVISGLIYNARE